jgi:pyruvate formate lyase activating enzyme
MRTGNCGIIGWAKNSFIDFPGTVSTVLFFSGCNLRCSYCHNPQIVRNTSLEEIPYAKVREFLEKRKGAIEGVVLSGGEPTMHPEILDIAKDVRSLGFSVKLDTNGLRPGVIRAVAPDYLALDIKTLPEKYVPLLKSPYADTPERLALSIKIALSMGEMAEIRITAAPGIIDRKVITGLAPMLQGARKVFLQPMQTRVELLDPDMLDKAPITLKELAEYREILLQFVDKCEIRGAG